MVDHRAAELLPPALGGVPVAERELVRGNGPVARSIAHEREHLPFVRVGLVARCSNGCGSGSRRHRSHRSRRGRARPGRPASPRSRTSSPPTGCSGSCRRPVAPSRRPSSPGPRPAASASLPSATTANSTDHAASTITAPISHGIASAFSTARSPPGTRGVSRRRANAASPDIGEDRRMRLRPKRR